MTALAFLAVGTGLLLIVAGIRDEDPRTIVVNTISGGGRAKSPTQLVNESLAATRNAVARLQQQQGTP